MKRWPSVPGVTKRIFAWAIRTTPTSSGFSIFISIGSASTTTSRGDGYSTPRARAYRGIRQSRNKARAIGRASGRIFGFRTGYRGYEIHCDSEILVITHSAAMADPTLYEWYSAEEAISLFGSPDQAQRLCNGQWVILDNTAICLTNIGRKWEASHFHKAASFYWVAGQPYRVSDSPGAKFVPAQVLAGSERKYSIRLFVRPPQAEKYLYVGELSSSHVLVKSINADRGA